MKKMLGLVAIAALVLMAGCGGDDDTDDAAPSANLVTLAQNFTAHVQLVGEQVRAAEAAAAEAARLESERLERERVAQEEAAAAAAAAEAEREAAEPVCDYDVNDCVPPNMNVGPDGICTATPCGSNGRAPDITCAELGLDPSMCGPDGRYTP